MKDAAAGVVAPVALALFAIVGAAQRDGSSLANDLIALGVILIGFVCALHPWRSRWIVVTGFVLAAVGIIVLCNTDPSNIGWFGLCVLSGWCAFTTDVWRSLAFSGAVVAVFIVEWFCLSSDFGWGNWIAGTAFTSLAGMFARRQQLLVEQLRDAQAGLADRTRNDERMRIARELHDVIGHALTASVLHITSARLALDDDPKEARRFLLEAERQSQMSLAEVRATVSLMRAEGSGSASPLPATNDMEMLVASIQRMGIPIEFTVSGDPNTLTGIGGLTLYRILQEALTNVVRHAPGAETKVCVSIGQAAANLEVASFGPPADPSGDGVGIIGMRERAEAIGGQLYAGPSAVGWRVAAVLPI